MPEQYIPSLQIFGIGMNINPVELSLTLKPVGRPWVRVSIDNEIYTELQLAEDIDLDIKFSGHDSAVLKVEHFNKADNDPDTAVVINSIGFFGISDPKFVWSGVYRPSYPEHYENKIPELPGQDYLGWNGVYSLEFGIPVFVWMHQTLDMGWLYD